MVEPPQLVYRDKAALENLRKLVYIGRQIFPNHSLTDTKHGTILINRAAFKRQRKEI